MTCSFYCFCEFLLELRVEDATELDRPLPKKMLFWPATSSWASWLFIKLEPLGMLVLKEMKVVFVLV